MKPSYAIAQCYENIRAVLDFHLIPQPTVLAKLVDRVMVERVPAFTHRLEELTQQGKFETWNFVGNHGVTALCGWRERVARCSMQVIVHTDLVEMDIDLWNPNFGVAPALGHLWECVTPGKTNPFAVAKGLMKRGIRPVLLG